MICTVRSHAHPNYYFSQLNLRTPFPAGTCANMGQHMTTASAPWRVVLNHKSYETHNQLELDDLVSYLRPLYISMLEQIGYVAAPKLDPDAVSKLHALMRQKADETGIDYVNNPISSGGFKLGLSLACVGLHRFPSFVLLPRCRIPHA